jgi:hypothetical protein
MNSFGLHNSLIPDAVLSAKMAFDARRKKSTGSGGSFGIENGMHLSRDRKLSPEFISWGQRKQDTAQRPYRRD